MVKSTPESDRLRHLEHNSSEYESHFFEISKIFPLLEVFNMDLKVFPLFPPKKLIPISLFHLKITNDNFNIEQNSSKYESHFLKVSTHFPLFKAFIAQYWSQRISFRIYFSKTNFTFTSGKV